jgi:hypothetical protein
MQMLLPTACAVPTGELYGQHMPATVPTDAECRQDHAALDDIVFRTRS